VLTAFILQGPEVHTVPEGGMLSGRFRVAEVQEESVLLTSPSGDKQARLDLSATAAAATGAAAPPRPPGRPAPGAPQ
jgi:hypothetical protein